MRRHWNLRLFPGVLSFFFFSGRILLPGSTFRSETLNYYWMPIIVSYKLSLSVFHSSFLEISNWSLFYILCVFFFVDGGVWQLSHSSWILQRVQHVCRHTLPLLLWVDAYSLLNVHKSLCIHILICFTDRELLSEIRFNLQ